MNTLSGIISDIKSSGEIYQIEVLIEGILFTSIIIENNEEFLNRGNQIFILFKETEISIGKNFIGKISLRNRFEAVVEAIDEGIILSEVSMNFRGNIIHSIITTISAKEMDLKIGESVTCFIKSNELMLSVNDTLKSTNE